MSDFLQMATYNTMKFKNILVKLQITVFYSKTDNKV